MSGLSSIVNALLLHLQCHTPVENIRESLNDSVGVFFVKEPQYKNNYLSMFIDSPSSQKKSPIALPSTSNATIRENGFCLVALVVREGDCNGMILPP